QAFRSACRPAASGNEVATSNGLNSTRLAQAAPRLFRISVIQRPKTEGNEEDEDSTSVARRLLRVDLRLGATLFRYVDSFHWRKKPTFCGSKPHVAPNEAY